MNIPGMIGRRFAVVDEVKYLVSHNSQIHGCVSCVGRAVDFLCEKLPDRCVDSDVIFTPYPEED